MLSEWKCFPAASNSSKQTVISSRIPFARERRRLILILSLSDYSQLPEAYSRWCSFWPCRCIHSSVWGCFPPFFRGFGKENLKTILCPCKLFLRLILSIHGWHSGWQSDNAISIISLFICFFQTLRVFPIALSRAYVWICMYGRGRMGLRICTYVCASVPLILSPISHASACTRFNLIYTQRGNVLITHTHLHKSVSTFHYVPNRFCVLQSKLCLRSEKERWH